MLRRELTSTHLHHERRLFAVLILSCLYCASCDAQGIHFERVKGSSPFPSPYPSSSNTGSGLALESCETDLDCVAERKCSFVGDNNTLSPCGGRVSCVCLSPTLPICLRTIHCLSGEVCANTPRGPLPICVSKIVEQTTSNIDEIEIGASTGLTLETCASECLGTRICTLIRPDQSLARCPGSVSIDDVCACLPVEWRPCSSTAECESAELCASTPFSPFICVSREAEKAYDGIEEVSVGSGPSSSPAPGNTAVPVSTVPAESDPGDPSLDLDSSPESEPSVSLEPEQTVTQDNEVCIDAQALQHMDRKDLVFEDHVWSRVLCDEMGSCATSGHMVIFRGKRMMMKTYCGMVSCVHRVVQVNSPKQRRALRVDSNTEGLQFTAFAARYGSRAEEMALAAAIRVGF